MRLPAVPPVNKLCGCGCADYHQLERALACCASSKLVVWLRLPSA